MRNGWIQGAAAIAILSLALMLAVLSGCAMFRSSEAEPAVGKTEAEVQPAPMEEESTGAEEPALEDQTALGSLDLTDASEAIAVAEAPESPVPSVLQQRFDIKVQDAQLQDVVQTLVKGKGLNVIIPKRLEGEITLDVSSVTLEEIFDVVLRNFGYSWRIDNKFLIITRGEPVKVFRINQAPLPEVKSQVEAMIGRQGQVIADVPSRTLTLVNCDPNVSNYVEEYIRAIDVKPPQAEIEIELFEVALDSDHELGIDWTFNGVDLSGWSGLQGNVTTTVTGDMVGQVIYAALTNDHVHVLLKALAQQGDLQMIASPKVVALDRQTSKFQVYDNIPYTSWVQVQENNALGVPVTNWMPTVAWREVGTSIEILPQISPDGYVTMAIKPHVETVTGTVGGQPQTNRREGDLYARARDGRTIVIGGFMFDNAQEITYKVPLIGDIPYIGRLFRMTTRTTKKTELVMFLTPHILTDTTITDFAEADRASLKTKAASPVGLPLLPE